MSIDGAVAELFFDQAPDYSFWDHPQTAPRFLVEDPIDRLTEDEVPIQELEDAYAVEAMIYGL